MCGGGREATYFLPEGLLGGELLGGLFLDDGCGLDGGLEGWSKGEAGGGDERRYRVFGIVNSLSLSLSWGCCWASVEESGEVGVEEGVVVWTGIVDCYAGVWAAEVEGYH